MQVFFSCKGLGLCATLLANGVCRASIQLWVLKTTVTILGEIISDYHKLQGILLLLINISLLWVVVRHVPYYSKTINCFQGTVNKCHLYCKLCTTILIELKKPQCCLYLYTDLMPSQHDLMQVLSTHC